MPTTLAPPLKDQPTTQIHSYRRPPARTRGAAKKTVENLGPIKKQHPWYDYGPILSHNCVYNIIPGARGIGKTFGAKKRGIDNFIKRGEQFIYLRRFKDELIVRDTFFADIGHLYPDWQFRANGNTFEAAKVTDGKPEWQIIGYAIALSTAQKNKSVSYVKVTLIIFDEFIIEKGVVHYLPDEANVFNNFFNTVDRYQDKTKALFLANAVSIVNPYFIKWRIRPDEADEKGFIKLGDGFIICHFPQSEDFAASVMETRFGKFIAGTDYAEYAVGNKFSDNSGELVRPKNQRARYMFTLELKEGRVSLWQDMMSEEYYALSSGPKSELVFTYVREKMGEGKTLLVSSDKVITRLRNAFRTGKIWFDSDEARMLFLDVFRQS